MIGGKCKGEEDDLLASSRENAIGSEMAKLSDSIEKYGEFLLAVAKLAALKQEKDCCHACVDSICSRIDSLHNAKRNLIIWLALDELPSNKSVANANPYEVEMMVVEIKQNLEKLNSFVGAPQKGNCSPN